MPLLPALILALAFPASAQLRNERGCTSKQVAAVEAAMPEARKRVADNWSQFAHCASGRTPDEPETITASPRKKK